MRGRHGFVLLVGDVSECAGAVRQVVPEACALVVVPSPDAAREWLEDAFDGPADGTRSLVGALNVDSRAHVASWNGRRLALTEHEFQILARLASEPGRVWTFEELYETAWGRPYLGDTSAVHAAIKRLRGKLGKAKVHVTIESVRSVGFRLTQRIRGRVRPKPFQPRSDVPVGVI